MEPFGSLGIPWCMPSSYELRIGFCFDQPSPCREVDVRLPGNRGRKVDVRLPGKGNSNAHGKRPAHPIITMIKWIRTSRLVVNNDAV